MGGSSILISGLFEGVVGSGFVIGVGVVKTSGVLSTGCDLC